MDPRGTKLANARDVVETTLPLVAAFLAHSLGLFTWSARVVLPSVLLFVAPALAVATIAHDPLTIAMLALYVWRIGRAMTSERDDRVAVATVFAAAFFIDAAALVALGHPIAALEVAFAAPFVRRIMLVRIFSGARVGR